MRPEIAISGGSTKLLKKIKTKHLNISKGPFFDNLLCLQNQKLIISLRASKQGYLVALEILGEMLTNGGGCIPDIEEAAKHFQKVFTHFFFPNFLC